MITIAATAGGTQSNGDNAYGTSTATATFRISENGATLVSGNTSTSARASFNAKTIWGNMSITSVVKE